MTYQNISLVNWGMGTTMIAIFALVCLVLALVIYNMTQSGKKEDEK